MSHIEQDIQVAIAQIIDKSRHHEEMILIDSNSAAQQILKFLQRENMLSFGNNLTQIAAPSSN